MAEGSELSEVNAPKSEDSPDDFLKTVPFHRFDSIKKQNGYVRRDHFIRMENSSIITR